MRFDLPSFIDPELWFDVDSSRAFYEQRPAGRGLSSPDEQYAVRAGAPRPAEVDPRPLTELARSEARTVSIRIHLPGSTPPAGVLLDIHGGDFYMGSPAANDGPNRRLAVTLRVRCRHLSVSSDGRVVSFSAAPCRG